MSKRLHGLTNADKNNILKERYNTSLSKLQHTEENVSNRAFIDSLKCIKENLDWLRKNRPLNKKSF